MKKFLGIFVLFALVTGCSLAKNDNYDAQEIKFKTTGNAVIDASLPRLTTEELNAFDLIEKGESAVMSTGPTGAFTILYGPLHDHRVVHGKKVGISFLQYTSSSDDKFFVECGYSPDNLNASYEMSKTGYGNMVAFCDVTSDNNIKKFYYRIVGNKGYVYDNNGQPFEYKIYDRVISYRLYDNKLQINYSGPSLTSGMYIHAGWNNWNDAFNLGMRVDDYPIFKYAYPGGCATANIDVPWWANYLDFVFNGNGQWDNNNGDDWHTSLKPLVDVSIDSVGTTNKDITIYYTAGTLNNVIAHYGFDNWNNVSDKQLRTYYGGQWTGRISVPSNVSLINMVFNDGQGNWENNFNKNWNFEIAR